MHQLEGECCETRGTFYNFIKVHDWILLMKESRILFYLFVNMKILINKKNIEMVAQT